MSITDLLPAVRQLNPGDKRQLVEEILRDLHDQSLIDQLIEAAKTPFWSPIEAYEAAARLQEILDAEAAR